MKKYSKILKSIFQIAKENNNPLILDGAMGSLLQQEGVAADEHLWMSKANIEHPKIIEKIYKGYINAGADIITTNTFRTNKLAVENSKYNSETLVEAALKIAKESIINKQIFIAGSNPPIEDCYKQKREVSLKEIRENHKSHIDLLLKYGSDFILNETQSHFDEIKFICEYCKSQNIPFVLSLFFTEKLQLLSGENVTEIIKFIQNYNPIAIGFNCIEISTFNKLLPSINSDYNWGMYLNCGDGSFTDTDIKCGVAPNEYLETVKFILEKKPSFIGACCGSSYEHIKKINEYING